MTTMLPAQLYLVMTPHVEFIRVYDQPDGYEKRVPYLGIMAITHLTDKVAWLHAAFGRIDRTIHAQALQLLRERGITTVLVERHGKMKTIELQEAAHEQPEHHHTRTA